MIAALLAATLLVLAAGLVLAVIVASNVKIRRTGTSSTSRLSVETPLGDMDIEARDNLRPESVGIPVYPGATREHRDSGGVIVNFDRDFGGGFRAPGHAGRHQLSLVTAAYSTTDSAGQVQEFYRSHLPSWVFTTGRRDNLQIELSEKGYKRIVAIGERNGRTTIAIASMGEPPVN